MQFSPSYTGENSAVKFPELNNLERSSQRSGQMAIRAEEQKLDLALKDRDTFMKLMEVDPVMAISTRDQMTQAALLDKYNNKGAEIMKRDGGRLTESGRMELMKEKALLTASQNKILGNQEQWKAAEQTIQRDTRGYYDKDYYEKARQNYFKTGEWDVNAVQVAPQDITALLGRDAPQSKYVDPQGIPMKDARGTVLGYSSMEYKRSKDEAQERILTHLQEEPVLKFVIRDFDNQPLSVQQEALKGFDPNGNGKLDPEEVQYAHQNLNVRDNPIVKWAINNPRYLASSMGAEPSTPKNVPAARTTGTGLPINIGGADLKVSPAAKRIGVVQYGDKTYADTYAFTGNTTLSNLPTLGGLRFRGTSSRVLKNGNITGKLKDYVADDDMIIIEAATGIPELDIETKGLVAIPANSIQGADNLPITINGKTTTLGTIRGQRGSTQTTVKKKAY